ncbi:hypothetical protein A6R68_12175, partial [Neotoma lepida]
SFNIQYEALRTYASLTSLPFLTTIITSKIVITDALQPGFISKETRFGFLQIWTFGSQVSYCFTGTKRKSYYTLMVIPMANWDESNGSSSTVSNSIWNISYLYHYALYEKNTCKSVPED